MDKAAARARRAAARNAATIESEDSQLIVQEGDETPEGDKVTDETLEEGNETLEEGNNPTDEPAEPLEEAEDAERMRIEAMEAAAEAAEKARRRQAAKEKRQAQQELATQAAIDIAILTERERAAARAEEDRLLSLAREESYREEMARELHEKTEEFRRQTQVLKSQIGDLLEIDEAIADADAADRAVDEREKEEDDDDDAEDSKRGAPPREMMEDRTSSSRDEDTEMDPIGEEAAALEASRKLASATAAAKAALAAATHAETNAARKLAASQDVASMARINIATRLASQKATTAVECLTPGQAMSGVLDYSKSAHAKLFKEATMTLTSASEAFSVTPENFADLVTQLKRRASNLGWYETINMVPTETVPDSPKLNLMENYRELNLAQIELHDVSYIAFGGRKAQDSRMMFEALWNSLSREGRSKLGPETSRFHITVGGRRYPSGNLLFKIIADKSVLTTRGTSRYIKSQLALIPEHLATLKFNIASFHEYVKGLVMELQAGGEEPLDLNRTLMMAYATVPGPDFKQYINHLQDQMDGNSPDGKALDWHYLFLMSKVENKYKTMNLQKTWSDTPDNQEMIALRTELRSLKKKWQKGKPTGPPKRGPRKPTKPNLKKSKAEAEFNKLKIIKPENPSTAELKHKGKTFKWCGSDTGGQCEQYVLHKPTECKGKLAKKKPPPRKGQKGGSKKSATMIVNAAAAYNDDDDSDDEMASDSN